MAQRTVSVRLTSQVQEYIEGMHKASEVTRQTATEGEKLAAQKRAFQELGKVLVGVGGAVTAVGVAALKTGIEYNTLQQTSRAAMTTMLGSAKAANAQMDKLDEFARKSPFAKQVFIQAQQQMLAFGIETKKVLPYLDALQNAVAASGGSNADIAELAEIFGKISATSKITAIDLQQFGRRGVDAASLIGSQMGKTGAQIREEITAGTLDAHAALDALAAGMQERFAGAAANVKETFAGATDRVKAAWRDLSSELATPFVSPDGGGMLIDFLNGVADKLREFQKLPEPIKILTATIGGLTGALLLAGGTVLLSIPKYVQLRDALNTLDGGTGKYAASLGKLGKAAGVAAATLAALAIAGKIADELTEDVISVEELTTRLKQLSNESSVTAESLDELTATAGSGGAGISGFGQAIDTLNMNGFMKFLDNAASLFGVFDSDTRLAKEAVANLDATVTSFVTVGNADRMAESFNAAAESAAEYGYSAEDVLELMPGLKAALIEQAEAAGLATDNVTLAKIATGELAISFGKGSKSASQQASSLETLQGVAVDVTDKVKSLSDEIRGFGSAQFDTEKATLTFYDALDDLTDVLQGGSASLDVTTVAGRDTRQAMLDVAKATNDYAGAVSAGAGPQAEYTAILEQGRQRLIEVAKQLGMTEEEAKSYADQLIATPETVKTRARFDGTEATNQFNSWLSSLSGRRLRVSGQFGAAYNANGGIYAYANGGISKYAQAFATGGFPTGIYSGGAPIHKFAEPETRWEAYISGKAGQEERNRQIWVETGRRLGVMPSAGPSEVVVSLAGAQLTLDMDGTPIRAIVREQVVGSFQGASATQLRSVLA